MQCVENYLKMDNCHIQMTLDFEDKRHQKF